MGDCIFCKIARREIDSNIVYEDDEVIAFLDINPGAEGHTLVVPKAHAEDLLAMDGAAIAATFAAVAKVSRAVKSAMVADGIGIYQNNGHAAGQLVMHMHVHVVPRRHGDNFTFNRMHPSPKQLAATAEKIRGAL